MKLDLRATFVNSNVEDAFDSLIVAAKLIGYDIQVRHSIDLTYIGLHGVDSDAYSRAIYLNFNIYKQIVNIRCVEAYLSKNIYDDKGNSPREQLRVLEKYKRLL